MIKIHVSIGLVAYNEEKRIQDCLHSILNSSGNLFSIDSIIVVSDGSIDGTVQKIKELSNSHIVIIDDTTRRGKATQLNKIFKSNKSPLLILTDADCVFDKNAVNIFVESYKNNSSISLFGGNCKYLPPVGFISKSIAASVNITTRLREYWLNSDNAFNSIGRIMALKKDLADRIVMPSTSGNDAYIYLYAKSLKLKFLYLGNAIVYYRIPKTVKDHLKQSNRHYQSKQRLQVFFKDDVLKYFMYPSDLIIKEVIKELISNPVNTANYLLIQVYVLLKRLLSNSHYKTDIWDISQSTK